MRAADDLDTEYITGRVDAFRAGDAAARDELLRTAMRRLDRLAAKMLARFPGVRRWEQSEDVLQNALVRLSRALETVRPTSTRAFFGLAAEQIRRELLDLARHYAGPEGEGANHDSVAGRPPEPAVSADAGDLDRWAAFHEAVDRLPTLDREMIGLVFYHGWGQAQIGKLFGVSDRQVRRWWKAAVVRLRADLGGVLPAM